MHLHRLEEALKGAMVDLSKRMQDIKETLDASISPPSASTEFQQANVIPVSSSAEPTEGSQQTGNAGEATVSLEESERLLDELLDLVESIDQARDLSTIGGLDTLLSLLRSQHSSLQWRAAEIAAACVQNTPSIQASFMHGGILPAVWPLLDAPNDTCRIKGMLALSCMMRGYYPAVTWFVDNLGIEKAIDMTDPRSVPGMSHEENRDEEDSETTLVNSRLLRKCFQLLSYVLETMPSETFRAVSYKNNVLLQSIADALAWSTDPDVRVGALKVAVQSAIDSGSLRLMQRHSGLVEAVQALQCRLDSLDREDWPGAEEEVQLSRSLMVELAKDVEAQDGDLVSAEEAPEATNMQLLTMPEQNREDDNV